MYANGIDATPTTAKGAIARRSGTGRAISTQTPCDASTIAPYVWVEIAATTATPQSVHARPPPRSVARSSARYESALVSRKRLYIRAYTPWKSSVQLAATSGVATVAGTRPAMRVQNAATTGTEATAKRAEQARSAVSPPPRWTTIQARRKWSGAPPRWTIVS